MPSSSTETRAIHLSWNFSEGFLLFSVPYKTTLLQICGVHGFAPLFLPPSGLGTRFGFLPFPMYRLFSLRIFPPILIEDENPHVPLPLVFRDLGFLSCPISHRAFPSLVFEPPPLTHVYFFRWRWFFCALLFFPTPSPNTVLVLMGMISLLFVSLFKHYGH